MRRETQPADYLCRGGDGHPATLQQYIASCLYSYVLSLTPSPVVRRYIYIGHCTVDRLDAELHHESGESNVRTDSTLL